MAPFRGLRTKLDVARRSAALRTVVAEGVTVVARFSPHAVAFGQFLLMFKKEQAMIHSIQNWSWTLIVALLLSGALCCAGNSTAVQAADDDPFLAQASKAKLDEFQPDGSIEKLRARLEQLEAENAKLREALRSKDESAPAKKSPEGKVPEKLPPKKHADHDELAAKKLGEKQASERDEQMAKLKELHGAIAKLQKEGRRDEAEKLADAAHELQRRLHDSAEHHEKGQQAAPGKEVRHETPELAERIQHLKREIEENARA